ncbi:helix-turn-helix transcriptional regulator [Arthrobacter citreus]|uniref:helix-turn-helix transcriptional regulator n=1 Tax=Arthrobacter citreus TaxID=1670 RepID=UPI0038119E0F
MKQLITPEQVAHKYGVTIQELTEWRRRNIGPDYYVLGTRVIRYQPEHVDRWFRDPANSRWHDFPAEAFTHEGPEGRTTPWLSVDVHRPLTWWRATPEQLGARVADPDHGAFPRWESYDQNWKAISKVIEDVGNVLASGSYEDSRAPAGQGHVHVPDPGLSDLELKIVKAWFSPGEAVTMDPWDAGWSDGRHRTWHTTAANPRMLLPIRGNSLGFATAEAIPRLGENWSGLFRNDLKRLRKITWLNRTDPVNQHFEKALILAAAGAIPPTTPTESTTRQGTLSASVHASFPASFTAGPPEQTVGPNIRKAGASMSPGKVPPSQIDNR